MAIASASPSGQRDHYRQSVYRRRHFVVTGKTFGITNIIALDAGHNVIQDQRVMVERDDSRVVNLHKGSERFTYACTPNCEPTLTIGDEKSFFNGVQAANSSKTKFSSTTSDAGSASNNSQ
ncbi:MAG TPA: pilus assembly protein N-terminal domain-containing protein [Hyphomicrobium sp.]|nr:pilus assembly protein N-terminal domain-containing protein [Hyphomicrobium sp.]